MSEFVIEINNFITLLLKMDLYLSICTFMLLTSCVLCVYPLKKYDNSEKIVARGVVPFYALIQIPPLPDEPEYANTIVSCGGTLIDPKWILTSGQCFKNIPIYKLRNYELDTVVMDFLNNSDWDAVLNAIEDVVIHPQYSLKQVGNKNIVKNDVALVLLRKPYKLSKFINTIRLPSKTDLYYTYTKRCNVGIAIGTKLAAADSDSLADYVLLARVPVVENGAASVVFYSTAFKDGGYISPGGGPFYCYLNNTNIAVQYGIISVVENSTSNNWEILITYTNVEKHLDFILKNVYPKVTRRIKMHRKPRLKSNGGTKGPVFNNLLILVLILILLKTVPE